MSGTIWGNGLTAVPSAPFEKKIPLGTIEFTAPTGGYSIIVNGIPLDTVGVFYTWKHPVSTRYPELALISKRIYPDTISSNLANLKTKTAEGVTLYLANGAITGVQRSFTDYWPKYDNAKQYDYDPAIPPLYFSGGNAYRLIHSYQDIDDGIFYVQKPMEINGYDDYDNIIAVSSGAWAYTAIDARKTHHLYLLSGDEFKVLNIRNNISTGFIGNSESHSTSYTSRGKRYHALHMYWNNVSFVDPFPTIYYKDGVPSDDEIYGTLSKYVLESYPYDRGDVLSLEKLYNWLGVTIGAISSSEVDAMLKGYVVDSRNINNIDYSAY